MKINMDKNFNPGASIRRKKRFERDRKIYALYADGAGYRTICEMFGLSKRQIQRIVVAKSEFFRNKLKGNPGNVLYLNRKGKV